MELLEGKKSEFYKNEVDIFGGKSVDIIEIKSQYFEGKVLTLRRHCYRFQMTLYKTCFCLYYNFVTFFLIKLQPHSVNITSCSTVRRVGHCEEQLDLLSLCTFDVFDRLTLH